MRRRPDHIRENRRLRAFTGAAMFGCGALIGGVEGLIPGGAPVSLAAGIIALAATAVVAFAGPRMPSWACALLGPFAVALIAFSLTYEPGPGDGAVLYMWPVLWMVFFFGRRGAIAIVASIAIAHGCVLLSLPPASGYFNRWIDVMASTVIVAVIFELLVSRNEQLVERLADEARQDALTGVLNRRGFDERAAIELAHARRGSRPLALAILDVDHFKQINDEWGHDTGDLVLAMLGRVLETISRETDAVARIGGEEFAVLMPGAHSDEAEAFTERVRAALLEARIAAELPPIRLSAGVAAADPPASTEALLRAADHALYIAKRNGRDRTVVSAQGTQGAPPRTPLALQP